MEKNQCNFTTILKDNIFEPKTIPIRLQEKDFHLLKLNQNLKDNIFEDPKYSMDLYTDWVAEHTEDFVKDIKDELFDDPKYSNEFLNEVKKISKQNLPRVENLSLENDDECEKEENNKDDKILTVSNLTIAELEYAKGKVDDFLKRIKDIPGTVHYNVEPNTDKSYQSDKYDDDLNKEFGESHSIVLTKEMTAFDKIGEITSYINMSDVSEATIVSFFTHINSLYCYLYHLLFISSSYLEINDDDEPVPNYDKIKDKKYVKLDQLASFNRLKYIYAYSKTKLKQYNNLYIYNKYSTDIMCKPFYEMCDYTTIDEVYNNYRTNTNVLFLTGGIAVGKTERLKKMHHIDSEFSFFFRVLYSSNDKKKSELVNSNLYYVFIVFGVVTAILDNFLKSNFLRGFKKPILINRSWLDHMAFSKINNHEENKLTAEFFTGLFAMNELISRKDKKYNMIKFDNCKATDIKFKITFKHFMSRNHFIKNVDNIYLSAAPSNAGWPLFKYRNIERKLYKDANEFILINTQLNSFILKAFYKEKYQNMVINFRERRRIASYKGELQEQYGNNNYMNKYIYQTYLFSRLTELTN